MKVVSLTSLREDDGELISHAQQVAEHAYAPYSKFNVGAAVRTQSGTIFSGCNVENAAYLDLHAEWAAISAAVSTGDSNIATIAVAGTLPENASAELLTPCGICRQKIIEFAHLHNHDIRILCCSMDRKTIGISTISELLPYPFGPRNLGR